ncbi:MAG TPA: SH3 domain-containing protein [Acidiferrobacteraceae bacterium]|nr:SH3 domain-containing protein [Acidiferrobacteraceae bacterium]
MSRLVRLTFVTLFCGLSMLHPKPAPASETVTVAVKKTSIRVSNAFFSPTVATVKYQNQLRVIKKAGDWLRVSHKGKTGWIHKSAITAKVIRAKHSQSGNTSPSKLSQNEVTLAGKGFNATVEGEFKRKNPRLNFAAVNKMQKTTITQSNMANFRSSGRLKERQLKSRQGGFSKFFPGNNSNEAEGDENED